MIIIFLFFNLKNDILSDINYRNPFTFMKSKSILYITEEILVENNAPSIHILETCKNFKSLGFNVTLLAPSLSKITNQDFTVKYIPMTNKLKSLLFQPLLLINMLLILAKQKNTIIYIRYFPLLISPILLSKILGNTCVLEVNGKIAEEAGLLKNGFVSSVYTFLDTINLKFSSKIITVTVGLKKYLINKYSIETNKIFVVENGVDIRKFKPMNVLKLRKKLNLDLYKTYIGYTGSIYKYQGIDYILKTAKMFVNTRKNIEFLIITNADIQEKTRLQKKINKFHLENIVKVIGPINHEKIVYYINAFDICLCYPTRFRDGATSPFKLFEYLACGKAVIVSDIKGLRNTFNNYVLFAQPENPKDLSKKINLLITEVSIKNNLESKAKAFISREHTWKQAVRKIVNILVYE